MAYAFISESIDNIEKLAIFFRLEKRSVLALVRRVRYNKSRDFCEPLKVNLDTLLFSKLVFTRLLLLSDSYSVLILDKRMELERRASRTCRKEVQRVESMEGISGYY